MAGKRRHNLPAMGESPPFDRSEIHDNEQEQTIRLDVNRWAGFRDALGEREFGVDEHGRAIELLRLNAPFTPLEIALQARVGRLASFDNAGVGRALGVDHDDRTGRLLLVSERVAGVRLSELLDRAFGRSLLPDLAAALFVLRRLLAIGHSLHRETGIGHLALAAERIVVTPRAGIVLVETAIAGAIEGLGRKEAGLLASLRLPPASANATAGDPRLDIAHIATVGVSMILGRAFEPDEPIDSLSPVLQEVEEVAAIRAGRQYAFALRQWLDRAVTIDPELSFPSYLDARLAIEAADPPPDCVRLRPALARFVQALALDSVSSEEAASIELERLGAVRVRQAAARVERPSPPPVTPVVDSVVAPFGARQVDVEQRESPRTDDVFWRRAVAARFQASRQQPTVSADVGAVDADTVDSEPVADVPAPSDVTGFVDQDVRHESSAEVQASESRSMPVVEAPATSNETRLAWVRAVTQQLEAARSAERAHSDAVVAPPVPVAAVPLAAVLVPPPPPRVEVAPPVVLPDVAARSGVEDSFDEVGAADPPVVADAPAVAMPTSRLANEPTLAELHDFLTAVDESQQEKQKESASKGSWLQAVKAHLRFTRRPSADEDDAVDKAEAAAADLTDEASDVDEAEDDQAEGAADHPGALKHETPAAVVEASSDESVDEDRSKRDAAPGPDQVDADDQTSLLGRLRARDPNRQAWTAAVTSALAVPEQKAPEPKAAPRAPLEVVHQATSIDAPRIAPTPVPRATPAVPLPDFAEPSRRGVPRWAIWTGLAASIAGVGGYMYTTTGDSSPAAEEAPIERPVSPTVESGSLSITSDPPGATVILDGRERGVTPIKFAEIPSGSHRVQLRGQGGTVSRTVAVKPGEEVRVDEAIFSGWIAVFAPFELQIFADGKQIGTTADARIMLAAGPHDVQLVNTRLGYRQTHQLEVKPGEVSPLNISAPEGVVKVAAPPDAELFVDGQPVGKGPGEVRVPIGTREVLVRHAQGEQKVLVTVTLAQPVEVTVGNQP